MKQRAWSPQAIRMLVALGADPGRGRYGYDLGRELALKSGSLYPILMRFESRGLLTATWEQTEPGRPPRHLYRITAAGLAELAALPSPRAVQAGRFTPREA